MLKLYLGEPEKYVYAPQIYFDNTYENDWLTDPLVKDMIQDVDKSTVVGPRLIDSPFLGPISPKEISGGIKTLILMLFDHTKMFNLSQCGDNCAPWALKIGEVTDVTVRLRYIMDFGPGTFEIEIVNSGKIVHNQSEFVSEAILWL